MTLAEYILLKLQEGRLRYGGSREGTLCKIPTEKQLQKWITEFYELQ